MIIIYTPFHITILIHHFYTPLLNTISTLHFEWPSFTHHWSWPIITTIRHYHVIMPFVLTITSTRHHYIVSTILTYNDEIELKDRNYSIHIRYNYVLWHYNYDMFVSSYADVSLGDSRTHSLFSERVIIAPFTIQVMGIIL